MNRTFDQEFGETETLLRRRLNELADHAPVAVRYADEITVSTPTADVPNRRRRAAGIGATIAVLIGGVGISTVAFQGASNPGGADSPEEAVEEFADALEREDVLGMIDVALPEEVSALRAIFEDATREVERVGILDESFSLDAVAGIDVAIPGLTLTTENLASDLAVVTATGGIVNTTFDPALFPLGSIVREVVGDELAVNQQSVQLSEPGRTVMLATVARDGRWYVSLGFTLAEYARLAAGVDFPPPTTIERAGVESPEAAALTFYERLAALDLEGALATMAPGEGDALLRYSPLFIPQAEAAIEGGRADGLTVSISGLEFETSRSGARRTLVPVTFVVEGTVPATWGGSMIADPTIPTVIYAEDGFAIVPPGQPVPATVDELVLLSDDPDGVLQGGVYNTTYALPDGTIQPIEFPTAEPDPPQPFRIERRDACTELTGPGIEKMFVGIGTWAADAGTDYSEIDGGHRICGGSNLFGGSIFSLLLVPGFPMELPSVSVVKSDDLWYVSPIGTLGGSLVDMVRSVPDGANLIDTPIAPYLFDGMGRDSMDSSLASFSTIPPECDRVAAVGTDGVAAVVPDPPVTDIRACAQELFGFDGDFSTSVAPQPAEVEAEVPASTAPPPEVGAGG